MVATFLAKNRLYEVLGLFSLFVVGIMLLTEGGHLGHLRLFGREITPMSQTTFYFVIGVLVLTDIVQTRYKKKLLKGLRAGDRTYKVHLDGYNLLPHLTGKEKQSPRKEVFYFSDTGDLTALRYKDWKAIFMEQKAETTLRAWIEPWTVLRVPLLFNLRRDPYERAYATSNTYYDWMIDRAFMFVPAQAYVAKFLKTFKEYPPRQKAASFSRVMPR